MSKIISDTIQGRSKSPTVSAGLNVTGVVTATSFSGDGSALTGIAATDTIAAASLTVSGITTATGVVNASSDVRISGNINAGIATFTSIAGDGSALTGVAATDNINTNNIKVSGITTLGTTTTVGNVTVGLGKSINFSNVQKAFIQEHSVGVGTTTTTGRNAGLGTAAGTIIFNSDSAQLQVYDGNTWKRAAGDTVSATGGSKDTTSRTGFAVHTFTGSGSLTLSAGIGDIEYVIYGGGGGGAGHAGAGAGAAGGVRSGTIPSLGPGAYTVTIGPGGGGGPTVSPAPGSDGGNSSIAVPSPKGGTIIAYGGGAGSDNPTGEVGKPGGCGGGGTGIGGDGEGGHGFNPTCPSPELNPALQPLHPYPITQGYDGGDGRYYNARLGGGGGGTGSAGLMAAGATSAAGTGGNGTTFTIT